MWGPQQEPLFPGRGWGGKSVEVVRTLLLSGAHAGRCVNGLYLTKWPEAAPAAQGSPRPPLLSSLGLSPLVRDDVSTLVKGVTV